MAEGSLPTEIGRFKIVEEVGRGGFGRVYRGYDPTVGRRVAIKVLNQVNKDVLTRFRNEAMVAGNLRHENIVTVYEYGTHEDLPFLAMEYLEGEDLHDILASHKPLTLLDKCNIMSQVAEGLSCAHKGGVVHRDVKPANIMVLHDGTVKIMDFGIARLTADRDATRLTQQGYLIGTLLYMAPEQFTGADFDSLCDIFAYGVIFHELITGRHPFEAPDPRSLMFKLSFDDPPPIRETIPDFPDALQQIITKLVHKDREMRYQSFKDVLFDLEPIRLDLQRERAATLLVQAQELFDKKQLEPAQTVLQQVLSLEPSNRVARTLWESVQKQLQQRTLQPRIESLLSAGEEHMAQRRFTDAVQAFEAALRLDRENVFVQGRLEEARRLVEHAKKAAQLLAEAKRQFEQQNLTGASRSVSEALRHDPQSPEAAEFLKTIQSVVDRRQAEQRVDEAIRKAQGLLLIPAYDDAIALLTGLGPDSESPKIQRVLEWVRSEQIAHQRKQKLQNDMATATDLLRDQRLEEAAQRLEELQREFPENKDVAHLLAYSQKELAAQARALAVDRAAATAGELVEAHEFDRALATLDEALSHYPGEGVLIRLLDSTLSAKGAWEREQAVRATVQRCETLRGQKRFSEAIEAVEATLQEFPEEPALVALLEQLEREWTEQRRREAVRKTKEQAEKLLDQGQPDSAVQALQQALMRYPGEADLSAVLRIAQEQVQARERARAIDLIGKDAARQAQARDFNAALRTLDRGLETWRDDAALVQQRADVLAAKRAWERQQAIDGICTRVHQLQAKENFGEALKALGAALAEFPGDGSLIALQQEVEKSAEEHRIRQAILSIASEARLLLSRGRLDEAAAMLNEAIQEHPGEAELERLSAQAQTALRARERALAVERVLQQSQEMVGAQQFDRARDIVEQAMRSYAGESGLIRQLDVVRDAESAWKREQEISRRLEQAAQFAGQDRFEDALKLLGDAGFQSPAIAQARERIEAERAQHLRREAIGKAAVEINQLLDGGRLEEAIQRLQRASSTYPEDRQWERLLARAQSELAARKRAEAVAALVRDARTRADQGKFADALKMLSAGLVNWPEEGALVSLRQSIEAEQAARQREQAIDKAVQDSEQLARQGLYERALAQLSESLRKYPDASALHDIRKRLEGEWEARKRAEAIAKVVERAQALLAAGRLDDTLRLLRDSNSAYPNENSIASLLAQAEKSLRQQERRRQTVVQGKALLAEQRFEDVIALLEPIAADFPGDSELTSLIAGAREPLELRRRQEAVAKVADEAWALAQRQEFDRAIAALDAGLKRWPGEQQLLEVRESTVASKEAWRRSQALLASIEKARALGREQRFAEAIAAAEAALQEHQGNATLLELLKEFRWRQDVVRARQLIEQGRPTEALELLAKGASDNGSDPEVKKLIAKARADELAAAIEREAVAARALADNGDFDGALAVLDTGLTKWPKATSLRELRQSTLARKADRERQNAIQASIAECEELAKKGQIEAGIELANKALKKYQGDPALMKVRERLEAELADRVRRAKRLRDIAELKDLKAAAIHASGSAEIAELLSQAHLIVSQYPADQEVQTAGAEPMRQLSDVGRARKELENRNFSNALAICEGYLAQYPNHVAFGDLKREAERGLRQVYVEETQARAAAEPDLQKRVLILQEALSRYPDEGALKDELRFTRNKLELADSIVKKARGYEAAGKWSEALEEWNSLLTIYGQYPGLTAEIERVGRAREKALSDSIEQWAQQIERALQSGDPAKATELLRRAQTEHPGATRLDELGRAVKELADRKKRARELLAQAQAASQKGRFAESQTCLRQAFQLDEGDAAFRKLVLNKLMDCAQAALQSDWRHAEALIGEATSLQPGFAAPDAMLRTIADRKKEAAVVESLAKAEQERKAGRARNALAELERTLQSYPNEPRIKKARDSVAAQVQKERQALIAELRTIEQQGQAATQAAEIEPLRARASAIRVENEDDAEVVALAASILANLELRTKELKRAHLRSLFTGNPKLIVAGVGAVTLLFGGIVFVPRLLRTPDEAAVNVTSNVPGTSVTVGDQSCVTPNCALKLRAGEYTLRAVKNGYNAATRQFTIAAGQAATPLALTLEPLPQLLQVNTNFDTGQVSVDGQRAGELRDGQFSSSIAPGRHTIQVTGGGADFRAQWDSAAGAPPEGVSLVAAKDVQATVIANAGASGSIVCDCDAQPIQVDGAAVGQTAAAPGTPTALKDLKEGARQIAVGSRSLVLNVRPNPTLNVFLSLDRNVGMLTVETGEDKVKVFLNNQLYRRTTERGVLRIPVEVGEYAIRVEKEGFQSPAPVQVALKKGEEKPVKFVLTPAPAHLEIAGSVPGAQVRVDGQRVGETDRNGSFRQEIAAGSHTVELSKDDYTPVRISEQFSPGKTIQLPRARVAMARAAAPKVSSPPVDPKLAEAQLWNQVANSTNPEDFDAFVRNHPGSTYADQARARANELRQQAQANSARQTEQAAWDRVDQNNRQHLQEYLSRFGSGAHAAAARAKVADLDRQAEALAAQRANELKAQDQAKRVAEEQAAVMGTLRDFESAYNQKDLATLQKLWVGLPLTTYRQQFRDATDLKFQLRPTGQPVVSGNTATATCTRSLSYKGRSGPPQAHTENVKVTLSREGSGWVIRSIEAQ